MVGLLVAFVISAILFLTAYNLFIPQDKVTTLIVVLVLLLCVAIGLGIAYLAYKFTKAWAIPIIAAVGGAMIGNMLFKIIFFKLADIQNGWLLVVGAVLGAVGFGYLGIKFNN